jgi:hypothetical protein
VLTCCCRELEKTVGGHVLCAVVGVNLVSARQCTVTLELLIYRVVCELYLRCLLYIPSLLRTGPMDLDEDAFADVAALTKFYRDIGVFEDAPVWTATTLGSIEQMQTVIDLREDVNEHGGDDGTSPLHEAVFHNDISKVRLLLKHSADVYATVKHGEFKGLTARGVAKKLGYSPNLSYGYINHEPELQRELHALKKLLEKKDQRIKQLEALLMAA